MAATPYSYVGPQLVLSCTSCCYLTHELEEGEDGPTFFCTHTSVSCKLIPSPFAVTPKWCPEISTNCDELTAALSERNGTESVDASRSKPADEGISLQKLLSGELTRDLEALDNE